MFYAAQALLLSRGIRRSTHSATIAAFNEYFVKTGEVPPRLFSLLRESFEDRAESDYGLVVITDEQAWAGIAAAREFVETINRRLERTAGDES
ncbi:HEPN domain-containing protein [Nitrospira calida]|jgi:uncharacterized protein (UPF0332 family)